MSPREIRAAWARADAEHRRWKRLADAALLVGFIIGAGFGAGLLLILPELVK